MLPAVENRLVVLVVATTENPSFSVIAPLVSRSLVLQLKPLAEEHLRTLVTRAVSVPRGLAGQFELSEEALDYIVSVASGDARRSLTVLEAAAASAKAEKDAEGDGAGAPVIEERLAAEAAQAAVVRYDRAGSSTLT